MKRVLYWLTDPEQGDFSGLDEEVMFGHPAEKRAASEPEDSKKEVTPEPPKPTKPHDLVVYQKLWAYWKENKNDEPTEGRQEVMALASKATASASATIAAHEASPWCDLDWSFGVINETERCNRTHCRYQSVSEPAAGYLITRRTPKNDTQGELLHLSGDMKDVLLTIGHFSSKGHVRDSVCIVRIGTNEAIG